MSIAIQRDAGMWTVGETFQNRVVVGTDRDLYEYLLREFNLGRFTPITLKEAGDRFHIPYSTLAQAAREGRIEVTRQFGVWLTSEDAIEAAMDKGSIRRR